MTRRVPIALLLCVQACLLFCALDLLPVWTDELFTLRTVAHPIREIIPIVQRDIHPPLYYMLLHAWAMLPLPWTGIAALRAFSVMWTLLATLLLDLFWTQSWEPVERWLSLTLFAFSPCLLLYGRMARSYSMQVALVVLCLGLLRGWMRNPRDAIFGGGAFVAILALLFTHYLPGVAILAGFALIGWRAIGVERAVVFLAGIAVGYSPWVITLVTAMRAWGGANGFSAKYTLTGNASLEQVLKVGFGVVSLTIGESFLAASILLVPAIVVLAMLGALKTEFSRQLAAMLAAAAVVGYLGVSRWVSYPFIPARMLWLLPFLCMAVALGILNLSRASARLGAVVVILLSYISSDILYFRRENFLNLGYAAPLPEIAARLNRDAQSGDVILVDSYNTDFQALTMYLSGRTRVIAVDPSSKVAAQRAVEAASSVWIVRNTRDISPGGLTTTLQMEACAGRSERDTLLEPYAEWQKAAMKFAGFDPPPTHFYALITCGQSIKLKGGEK